MATNPEAFAPGEYIQDEIDARGWTQLDLADILGRPPQAVNEIIKGKRAITPETATALGEAFGTSPQMWMNLESAYQLAKLRHPGDEVQRKSKLYQIAPISEMQRRGWIEKSSNTQVVESQVLQFFSIRKLDGPIDARHAARKSTDYGSVTPSQRAWFCQAKRLARTVPVANKYSVKSHQSVLNALNALKSEPEEARHVPKALSDHGIRFLVVEQLAHSKVDGACFWLSDNEPVVVLTLRYDRIDWFWHTLMHEIGHLGNGDGKSEPPTIDMQLVGTDAQPESQKNPSEVAADKFATNFLVDSNALKLFIARVHPLYSRTKIAGFAKAQGVHAGIVVGQLQHLGKIPYSHSRSTLVPVKQFVIGSALADGWGRSVAV